MTKAIYRTSYANYLKSRFGGRIQKITVDAKFTCPNRDGLKSTGGCTFCNNESFGTATKVRDLKISEQVLRGIEFAQKKYKNIKGYLAYFQSYSNTYAPLEQLKDIYEQALDVENVIGISVGTRPDCIDEEKIAYFEKLAIDNEVVIEYGLESMFDETLMRINRCHDYQCFLNAIEMTKNRGIKIGAHLIIGFPWETREQWVHTAKELSKLPIDYLKIHQLHIVKNTLMGNEYKVKPFPLLTKNEYIDAVAEFLCHLNPDIIIERLFASAPKEMTLSEYWPESISELNSQLEQRMKLHDFYQGILFLGQK